MSGRLPFIVIVLFLSTAWAISLEASQKRKGSPPASKAGKADAPPSVAGVCCDTKTLNYLAAAQADVNERLRKASLIACVEEIKTLLAKGANVNAKDANGETALTLASIQGAVSEAGYRKETSPQGVKCRVETVRILVENGANADSMNTALANSVFWGRVAVVEFLLGKNLPLAAKNRALIETIPAPYNAETTLTMMLDSGAAVDARDANGNTAFMLAVAGAKMRLAQMLLAKGAEINAKNREGSTPLIEAVVHLRGGGTAVEFVKFLLANKADVNARNNRGETALVWAGRYQDAALSQLLKRAGAKE